MGGVGVGLKDKGGEAKGGGGFLGGVVRDLLISACQPREVGVRGGIG